MQVPFSMAIENVSIESKVEVKKNPNGLTIARANRPTEFVTPQSRGIIT